MQPLNINGEPVNTSMADLPGHVGEKLGPTDWVEMTQEQVNAFADLTGDHNYIHIDPERRQEFALRWDGRAWVLQSVRSWRAQDSCFISSDAATAVNYGMDKVRFPAPLPVGRRWRGVAEIAAVEEIKGGLQVRLNSSIEVEDSERPAVAAECLVRFYA